MHWSRPSTSRPVGGPEVGCLSDEKENMESWVPSIAGLAWPPGQTASGDITLLGCISMTPNRWRWQLPQAERTCTVVAVRTVYWCHTQLSDYDYENDGFESRSDLSIRHVPWELYSPLPMPCFAAAVHLGIGSYGVCTGLLSYKWIIYVGDFRESRYIKWVRWGTIIQSNLQGFASSPPFPSGVTWK